MAVRVATAGPAARRDSTTSSAAPGRDRADVLNVRFAAGTRILTAACGAGGPGACGGDGADPDPGGRTGCGRASAGPGGLAGPLIRIRRMCPGATGGDLIANLNQIVAIALPRVFPGSMRGVVPAMWPSPSMPRLVSAPAGGARNGLIFHQALGGPLRYLGINRFDQRCRRQQERNRPA